VGSAKRKAVVNAEQSQLDRVQRLIDAGRYRTVSEFVREAVDEKLERIEQDRIAEAVERYVAAGHANEDGDLIDAQAFDVKRAPRHDKRSRRAAR
jgi:Arc/MetJ-type ribon-helix-helix transcriptional regulator